MPTITFKVAKDGSTVESDMDGFVGPTCKDTIEPILDALGGNVLDSHDKPEMNAGVEVGA